MEERLERTIYVIAASPEGPVKLGISNDASKRLKQLQTGQDKTLVLYAEEKCRATHTHLLEKLLHKQLAHYRIRGEWFEIDVDTAISEVKFAIIRWESDDSLDRVIKANARRLTKT